MDIIKKARNWLSCRDVLWVMVFFGFAINYMLRMNMNLAIVAMVVPRSKSVANIQCNHDTTNITNIDANITSFFPPNTENSSIIPVIQYENRYTWNEHEQGLVLGSYYWLHWLTQIPGGLLARKYGTKKIFGYGNFLPAVLGFLIPRATRQHLYVLVCLRALQGLIAGITWPAMHSLTAKWIPPNERSKFVSAYLGSSIGVAVTYPLCATIISSFGWEAAFTISSIIGVVWYCLWLLLVYDSPSEHPRISEEEKSMILRKLANSVTKKPTRVPWKAILTSRIVWINVMAHWGSVWGLLTFMTQGPTYFNFIHGWNVNATGILSGLPHFLRTSFSYFFSTMCDWLLRNEKMSRTNVRKLSTFMCTGVQGLFTLGLAFSGCHPYLAIAFMMAGITVNGSVSSGVLPILVDQSPNYASILLGICGTFVAIAGFVSTSVVSALTYNNQTIEQWRMVYIVAVCNLFISCIAFMSFGTAKEQPWNQYYKDDIDKEADEMHVLSSMPKLKDNKIISKDNDKLILYQTEDKL